MKTRRILALMALAMAICAGIASAQDEALAAFRYDPAKMDVGTCYEYRLSDQKMTKGMSMYVYVKAPDNILVYKDYSTVLPMVLHLDLKFSWKYMMFSETYCINPFWESHLPGMNKESMAEWDYARRRLPITMVYFDSKGREKKQAMSVEANKFPTFDHSIYHLDMLFSVRHLIDDSKPLTIGGFYAGYYIESVMTYTKDEVIDGRLCKRYDIRGKGLMSVIFKANQRIWIPKDDPLQRPIRYENDMKISPFDNILLTLVSERKMTLAQWDAMVLDFDKLAKARLRLE